MRSLRLLGAEWAVLAGPEAALPVVALIVFTALHAFGPPGGTESWRALFVENCQSLLPVGIALAAVPALLRDAEHGTVEGALVLPARAVAAARLLLVLGGGALLSILWLGLLAALWGPVAFGAGMWAALGPTLWLSGLGALGGAAAGRATVGYLLVLGWPTGDLVLRLLGAFQAFPALQWLNVFAYRWPLATPSWPAVAGGQAVAGAALLLWALLAARRLLERLI
jgi:hypothetical protein